uniref:Uncharacterized protein n=1 Tax=Babesia bovis TaxID=5865 RepID=S6C7T4_BABBO|nr:hypothetical protein [Babesia bovis]
MVRYSCRNLGECSFHVNANGIINCYKKLICAEVFTYMRCTALKTIAKVDHLFKINTLKTTTQ